MRRVQIFCDAGKRSHFRDFAQFPDPDRTEVGNCHSSIRLDVASRPLDRGAPRRAVVAGASSRMMPSRSTRRQPVAQPIEIASVLTRRRRAAPIIHDVSRSWPWLDKECGDPDVVSASSRRRRREAASGICALQVEESSNAPTRDRVRRAKGFAPSS